MNPKVPFHLCELGKLLTGNPEFHIPSFVFSSTVHESGQTELKLAQQGDGYAIQVLVSMNPKTPSATTDVASVPSSPSPFQAPLPVVLMDMVWNYYGLPEFRLAWLRDPSHASMFKTWCSASLQSILDKRLFISHWIKEDAIRNLYEIRDHSDRDPITSRILCSSIRHDNERVFRAFFRSSRIDHGMVSLAQLAEVADIKLLNYGPTETDIWVFRILGEATDVFTIMFERLLESYETSANPEIVFPKSRRNFNRDKLIRFVIQKASLAVVDSKKYHPSVQCLVSAMQRFPSLRDLLDSLVDLWDMRRADGGYARHHPAFSIGLIFQRAYWVMDEQNRKQSLKRKHPDE